MIRPIAKARRRPMMSPIFPPVSMNMAMVRQYRVMTAWIVVTVVSKSATSVLIDTFITDWSSTITNCAVARATSGHHFFMRIPVLRSSRGPFKRMAVGGSRVSVALHKCGTCQVCVMRLSSANGSDGRRHDDQ